MDGITIETIEDGSIEQCRELCDELMALQKSRAVISPESFEHMSFDTRLRPSYEKSTDKQIIAAKKNGVPEGYIFSTAEDTEKGDKSGIPDWLDSSYREKLVSYGAYTGFYPNWAGLPDRCGCLNHLYLRESLRGMGIGVKLCDMSMEWFKSIGIDLVFVYISNGNDEALDFYIKYGFKISHDVFGGFIKGAYITL